MLVYLDQNHVSRLAKYLRGQPAHEAFGALYAALRAARPQLLASGFHVLETRGGYLLPTLQGLFAEAGGGDARWIRPWQEVVERQIARAALDARDLLADEGDDGSGGALGAEARWHRPARLEPLDDLDAWTFGGDEAARRRAALAEAAQRFGIAPERGAALPFFRLLARTVAFRLGDRERLPAPGDTVDLLAAAVVAPYADLYGTDRYVAELLRRVGGADVPRGGVHSGRRAGVLALARALERHAARTAELAEPGMLEP